jgi:hypothetical protein
VAFVKLVEHDRADPWQLGSREQSSQQHALGEVTEPCLGSGHLLEADAVAHEPPQRLPELLGDALGGKASRDPPGLGDQHLCVFDQPRRLQSGR